MFRKTTFAKTSLWTIKFKKLHASQTWQYFCRVIKLDYEVRNEFSGLMIESRSQDFSTNLGTCKSVLFMHLWICFQFRLLSVFLKGQTSWGNADELEKPILNNKVKVQCEIWWKKFIQVRESETSKLIKPNLNMKTFKVSHKCIITIILISTLFF